MSTNEELPLINGDQCKWCGYTASIHTEKKKQDCLNALNSPPPSDPISIFIGEGTKCPKCGADEYDLTRIIENSDNMITICDECDHEW